MPTRIEVLEENGITLARVPCELAWDVIGRLAVRGVCATYRVCADQLLVYVNESDLAAAQLAMDRMVDSPRALKVLKAMETVDQARQAGGWMAELLAGHHVQASCDPRLKSRLVLANV